MPKRQSTAYAEPEQLDRIAFGAYFMGAIFPLVTLAVVVERYVLPDLGDPVYGLALIGLVISLSTLSLCSFFLLRRSARASLRRMDDDNLRLASLLRVSSELAWAEHGHLAAETAANSALELAAADVAFVLIGSSTDDHPVLLESAGDGAAEMFATKGKMITELAALVMSGGRPVLRGPDDSAKNEEAKEISSAAVVPIPGDDGHVHGALAVLHETTPDAFDPAQVDALTTLGALLSVSLRNSDRRESSRSVTPSTR
ncbi:MAG: GAF domain-containing protein [Myxococcales bacterium]|nr:GAF domain-containing protein [Myxococcales bacterium]